MVLLVVPGTVCCDIRNLLLNSGYIFTGAMLRAGRVEGRTAGRWDQSRERRENSVQKLSDNYRIRVHFRQFLQLSRA